MFIDKNGNFQVTTGAVSFITDNIAIVNGYGTSVPASAPDDNDVLRSGNYGRFFCQKWSH